MFDRPLAILGVDSTDPVLKGLVGRLGRQTVNEQIFRGAAVLDAIAEIDFEPADTNHPLDPRQVRLALLQGAMRSIPLARDLFQMLPHPLGRGRLGQDVGGIWGHGAGDLSRHFHMESRRFASDHLLRVPPRQL